MAPIGLNSSPANQAEEPEAPASQFLPLAARPPHQHLEGGNADGRKEEADRRQLIYGIGSRRRLESGPVPLPLAAEPAKQPNLRRKLRPCAAGERIDKKQETESHLRWRR